MSLHKYTIMESSNLQLFQAGFDVIGEHNSNTQSPESGNVFVALQCVGAVTPGTTAFESQFVQIESATSQIGDDLGAVFLRPGDVIYGRFTGVVNHTNSNATLLGYRGPS